MERGEVDDTTKEAESVKSRQPSSKAKGKKVATKVPKKSSADDEIAYLSDNEEEGSLVDIDKIELIDVDDDEGDEIMGDMELSEFRKNIRIPDPAMGLRPVRAAREPVSFDDSGTLKSWSRRGDRAKPIVARGENVDLTQEDDPNAAAAARDNAPKSPSPSKKRRKSSTRDTKPSFETFEERREKEIIASDLQTMKNELVSPTPSALPTYKGKSSSLDPLDPPKLYLFQFPPLTPMLVAHVPRQSPALDPSQSAPGEETEPIDVDASAQPADKSQPPPPPPPPTVLNALNSPPLPNGLAGRMNVHQSGRVTIEWGCGDPTNPDEPWPLHGSEDSDGDIGMKNATERSGIRTGPGITNFDVNLGMEVDFLQDVVLLNGGPVRVKDEDAAEEEGEGDAAGKEGNEEAVEVDGEREAFALGQVRMKFVVVPDWEKIFE